VVEGKEKRQTRKDRFRFSRNRKRKKTKRKTEFTLLKVIESRRRNQTKLRKE